MSDSDQTPKDNAPSLLASLPGLSNVDPATSPPVEHCEEFVSSQASTPSSLDQPVLHHENYEPWSAANRNRSVAGPYPRPPVSRYEGREESLVTFIARFIGLSLRTLFSGPPPSRPFDTPEEGGGQSPITLLQTRLKSRFPSVEFDIAEASAPDSSVLDIYIVVLNQGCDVDGHILWAEGVLNSQIHSSSILFEVKHRYKHMTGYSAQLNEDMLFVLAGSPDVESITQNRRGALAVFNSTTSVPNDEIGAPWGLHRIASRESLPSFSDPGTLRRWERKHHRSHAAKPVDVYVIDSGIYVEHSLHFTPVKPGPGQAVKVLIRYWFGLGPTLTRYLDQAWPRLG